jgi:hypothetical protein
VGEVIFPVELDVVATYGTTLFERRQRLALNIVPFPRDLIAQFSSSDEVAAALGVDILLSESDPSKEFLTYAIAAILAAGQEEGSADLAVARLQTYVGQPPGETDGDRDLLAFAFYCASEPVVLIEQSPITKKVLAILAGAGTTITIAAVPVVGIPLAIVYGATTIVGLGTATAVMERLYDLIAPKGS